MILPTLLMILTQYYIVDDPYPICVHRFDLVKSQSRCEHLELQLTSTMSELTRRPLTSVQPEEKPQEDHLSRATSETKSISDGTSSDEVINVYVCIDPLTLDL